MSTQQLTWSWEGVEITILSDGKFSYAIDILGNLDQRTKGSLEEARTDITKSLEALQKKSRPKKKQVSLKLVNPEVGPFTFKGINAANREIVHDLSLSKMGNRNLKFNKYDSTSFEYTIYPDHPYIQKKLGQVKNLENALKELKDGLRPFQIKAEGGYGRFSVEEATDVVESVEKQHETITQQLDELHAKEPKQ
jgi:hypothetical protein